MILDCPKLDAIDAEIARCRKLRARDSRTAGARSRTNQQQALQGAMRDYIRLAVRLQDSWEATEI